jgi:hypothetical protein
MERLLCVCCNNTSTYFKRRERTPPQHIGMHPVCYLVFLYFIYQERFGMSGVEYLESSGRALIGGSLGRFISVFINSCEKVEERLSL